MGDFEAIALVIFEVVIRSDPYHPGPYLSMLPCKTGKTPATKFVS
jgi:hypothetical protein